MGCSAAVVCPAGCTSASAARRSCVARYPQQDDGVETRVDFLKAGANFVGRAHVGGQPLMRRHRRAVGVAHARPVALLAISLNDGWKKFT